MSKKSELKSIAVEQLHVMDYNPNEMKDSTFEHLRKTIKERGFMQPLTVCPNSDGDGFIVIDGAHRLQAYKDLGKSSIPCYVVPEKKQSDVKVDLINLNQTKGEFNQKKYAQLIKDLSSEYDRDQIKEMINMSLSEQEAYEALLKQNEFKEAGTSTHGSLAADYISPPFSILDSRKSNWLSRKREWWDLLGKDELGVTREGLLKMSKTATLIKSREKADEFTKSSLVQSNASIFDPVLAEIMYLWFCPKGGQVLDPFAGDVSQSIVAAIKGYKFKGIELRQDQIDVHMTIAKRLGTEQNVDFICGDAYEQLDQVKPESADFLFSCPPYYDLEQYSKDPKDLSNMSEEDFDNRMAEIFKKSAKALKPNRFSAWVISEVRRKSGIGQYKGFVPKLIKWAEDAGLLYYNEIILINAIGTLPLRVRKYWESNRKIGRMHQNILVFYKPEGDLKELSDSIGHQDLDQVIKTEKEDESHEQERAE